MAALAMLAGLSACQSEPVGGPLTIEVAAASPVSIIQTINAAALRCWIRSGDKAFRNYRLVPEADTTAGKPRILITRKGSETGRPQMVIEAAGDPSGVSTYGPLTRTRLANRINADIIRWTSGDTGCGRQS